MKSLINTPRRLLRVWGISLLSVTALAMILRCLNLFLFFDRNIGYYRAGAALPVIERVWMAVVSLLIVLGGSFLFRGKTVIYPSEGSRGIRIASILCALSFVAYTVICLNGNENSSWTFRPLLVLSIIAAAYFLLHTAADEIGALPRFITALAVILWLLFSLSTAYFDILTQMNTPDKLLFQVSCVMGMLFAVSELRTLISKPNPVIYFLAHGAALFFMGAYAIPSLLAGAFDVLTKPEWFYASIPMTGFFLYLAVRTFRLMIQKEEEPIPEDTTPTEETEPSDENTPVSE